MDHIQQLQKKMDELKETFSSQMASFESSVALKDGHNSSLDSDYMNFKKLIWKAVESLQEQMGFVLASLEDLETRSRSGMLLLHGVAESEEENVPAIVVAAFKESLQVQNVSTDSFFACHRLGRKLNSKPRPILVKFGCLRTRAAVWAAKRKFKGSGKTLSEFLTASRHAVFLEARRIHGVRGSWTSDGRVVVQCSDGRRHKVTTMAGLRSLPAPGAAGKAAVNAEDTTVILGRAVVAKKAAPAQTETAEPARRARNTARKYPAASGPR